MRSHLLRTITIAVPAASIRSARRWSWWVTPSLASMTKSAASARSTASQRAHEAEVLGRLVDAAPPSHARPCRRTAGARPRSRRRCRSLSRVVPGRSCTTARSSPTSRLNRVDLPDVRSAHDGDGEDPSRDRPVAARLRRLLDLGWQRVDDRVEEVAAPPTVAGRHREADRRVRVGRTASASASRRSSSTLLATTRIGTDARRSWRATLSSSSVTPTVTSTTNNTTSAETMARSA